MNRLSLLLVDDDPDIRAIAEISLAIRQDFHVTSCSSGFQALKLLREPTARFDVILLDMTLIDTTGLEIMADIGARDGTATPVIFFTASTRRDAVGAYLKAGAAGVISKPFDPLSLAEQVLRILTAKESGVDAP